MWQQCTQLFTFELSFDLWHPFPLTSHALLDNNYLTFNAVRVLFVKKIQVSSLQPEEKSQVSQLYLEPFVSLPALQRV